MVVNTSVVNQTIWCNFRATRLYTILLNNIMSSVIDKFEQELKNTNIVEYMHSTKTEDISAEKITEMSNRRNTLHNIINAMKQMKLSESIWNKFNHEEIEEIATAFNNVLDDFRSENDGLYQTIQDWEDWADRRPY